MSNPAAKAELRQDLATRDKVRAVLCSKGYTPRAQDSLEVVAKNLPDQKCFDQYDRETVQWSNDKRLHALLLAGPLRAMPDKPTEIFATAGNIGLIRFATGTPVAVTSSGKSVEIVDIGSGISIFLDQQLSSYPSELGISPNGRVFAVDGTGGVDLRDSQTGEILRNVPGHHGFTWIDSLTGIASRMSGSDLIDLADGVRAVPVRGMESFSGRALLLPDTAGEFLVNGYGTMLHYAVKRESSGVQALLLDQHKGLPAPWSNNLSDLPARSTWVVEASDELWTTNIQTRETENVSLKPMVVRAATPLPNADEVLLLGNLYPLPATRALIYSISKRTLTPVEDDQLAGIPATTGSRTVFIPVLNRVAAIVGNKVKLLGELKRGPQYTPDVLARMIGDEQRALEEKRQKEAAAAAAAAAVRYPQTVSEMTSLSGDPLSVLAKSAKVEGVGVYESVHRSQGKYAPGSVTINMEPGSKPIVLVLSSHEPVAWIISGAGVGGLKAVLLSGSGYSTVTYAELVPVARIGSGYASRKNTSEYRNLQREVVERVGKKIDHFQGEQAGDSFTVGGP